MRILSISAYHDTHTALTIQLETIQPQHDSETDMYGNDFLEERLNKHLASYFVGDFPPFVFRQKHRFNARDELKDTYHSSYECHQMTISIHPKPARVFKLITALEDFYKNHGKYSYDYILFDKESILHSIKHAKRKFDSAKEQLLNPLYPFYSRSDDTIPTLTNSLKNFLATIKEFDQEKHKKLEGLDLDQPVWDASSWLFFMSADEDFSETVKAYDSHLIIGLNRKIETNRQLIAGFLSEKIAKLYPTYEFLNAFQLSDNELQPFQKLDITNALKGFVRDTKDLLTAVDEQGKLDFLKPCLGQKAHDGGSYKLNYTEIQLLRGAFSLRQDGRLSIKLKDNPAYQEYYAPGKRNHDILKDELMFLGNILNFRLADDTNYDDELIFTEESTALLLKYHVCLSDTLFREALQEKQGKEDNELVRALKKPFTPHPLLVDGPTIDENIAMTKEITTGSPVMVGLFAVANPSVAPSQTTPQVEKTDEKKAVEDYPLAVSRPSMG